METFASSAIAPRSFWSSSTGIFAFLVGGLAIHLLYLIQSDSTGYYLLALLGLVQLSPMIFGVLRRSFSYLEFALVSQFLFFTEGRFTTLMKDNTVEALPPEYLSSIREMIICSLIVIITHSLFRPVLNKRREGEVGHEYIYLPSHQKKFIALFLLASFLGSRFLPEVLFVPFLMLTGLCSVLAVTSRDSKQASDGWLTRFVLAVNALGYFLTMGSMSLMGQYLSYYFIMLVMRGNYKYLPSILPVIVVLSAIQTVKADFRKTMLEDQAANTSLSERITFVSESIATNYVLAEEVSEDVRSDKLVDGFSRVGDNSLELIMGQTPSLVPFWEGESYSTIPYMFIPRVLWPDKPSRVFWNKLGRTYGVLSSDDEFTSVGVNVFAEGYMNFGYAGMYVVAAVMGFLLFAAEQMGVALMGGKTYFGFIYFFMVVGNFSSDLGSILQSLFINVTFVLILRLFLLKPNERDAYGTLY